MPAGITEIIEAAVAGVRDENGAGDSEEEESESEEDIGNDEVLSEARLRLLAGLKRYFHSKRAEGLLSGMVRHFVLQECHITLGI